MTRLLKSPSHRVLLRRMSEEKPERKGIDIADWIKLIGYVAAILVASTSLLSSSGYIPSWWFSFSLIFLIGLILSVPVMIFYKPISKETKEWRLEQKRNAVAERRSLEFENLVNDSISFNSTIRSITDKLRAYYGKGFQGLQTHGEDEIRNSLYEIQAELKQCNKSFRDLYLIVKNFELVLRMYKYNLRAIEEFVNIVQTETQKPVMKEIEIDFESFREKYNYFVKDFKEYCQKVNQEIGDRQFPEWAIEHVQKW
jgi:hypothetical protein